MGTARYASINSHLGVEQSRRDDMESLGYVLVYFILGSLPWQGLEADTKEEKYDKIKEKKRTTSIEALCSDLPPQFAMYFNHVRSLDFDAGPDYSYLRKIFHELFVRKSFQNDYTFDWDIYKHWVTMDRRPEDAKEPESGSISVAPSLQQIPNLASVAHQHFEQTSGGMFLQSKRYSMTEEQLSGKAGLIYTGLCEKEKICIQKVEIIGNELLLQAQRELRKSFLCDCVDFLHISNHPAARDNLKRLAEEYKILEKIWNSGIRPFLESLQEGLPLPPEHVLSFLYWAYKTITLLLETVPQFKAEWIETLGNLARYLMVVAHTDRTIYSGIARYWYIRAADLSPDVGRVQHHLAVIARPDSLQQLFYYSKALISVQPFTNARDSILRLFEPLLDPAKATTKYSGDYHQFLIIFVEAHGVLFTRHNLSTFLTLADEFLSQLDRYAGSIDSQFREQGVYIMASNYAAIFGYGHDDAEIPVIFNQARRSPAAKLEILDKGYQYWQKPSCHQVGIDLRVVKDASIRISSSGEASSLASYFAFTTLYVILGCLGD